MKIRFYLGDFEGEEPAWVEQWCQFTGNQIRCDKIEPNSEFVLDLQPHIDEGCTELTIAMEPGYELTTFMHYGEEE